MIYQTQLFQIKNFNFKLYHILVIGVLILAFSTSFLIRSQPADYGFELNEFDPFFNFRATEYIVENGYFKYFEWYDEKSWYLPSEIPGSGRDISATSQVMLHTTAAITYQLFGGNLDLYDFTILFPAIIGSLTVIIIFGLVRLFAGTLAGLFASLFFAVSLPIILRGTIGWFKSEPLGIFYGLLGLYLFLSGIQSENKKIAISKIIFGGIIMSFALSSWGGMQFLIIPIGLFIFVLPFVRKNHNFLLWSIPLFTVTFLLMCSIFERPGLSFVFGLGGLSLIIPTIFSIICIFIQKLSGEKNKLRNGLIILIAIILVGSFLLFTANELELLSLPTFRYLNALNPLLTSSNPLIASVAEHSTPAIEQSFILHSSLMLFSGLGIWLILTRKISKNEIYIKNDMKVFVLCMSMPGVYIGSIFMRLEVFASISLIILSSIGLAILTKEIFKIELFGNKKYLLKIPFVAIIFILFIIPLVYPVDGNWIAIADYPPVILTGGTTHPPNNNWLETLEWIKMNTPENSIVLSWWDYGYWITGLSERTTLIDNATLGDKQIERVATIFLSSPDDAWTLSRILDVDYLVVFVVGESLNIEHEGKTLYTLGNGGDESKVHAFIKIIGVDPNKYLHPDASFKNNFLNETLLGKLIPFTPLVYHNFVTQEQSLSYKSGYTPIFIKDIKLNSDTDTPFNLVYGSSSFTNNQRSLDAVLVYKINENYKPSSETPQEIIDDFKLPN